MSTATAPNAFSLESRAANLRRLKAEQFDVLILGGGINGAGIARDLALRGLNVALVEQRYFGSGTSSRNSHLIHGGLRYLKYFQFGLVRESLRERATLLRIAPHLVEPQAFLMPFYSRSARYFYGAGLWLYERLAGASNVEPHRMLTTGEVRHIEPGLDRRGLAAGALFYDARVRSARFVLENIFDAARGGAVVVNYARGEGNRVADMFTGERFAVRARQVVDATGPWEGTQNVRLVRGSHLLFPRLTAGEHAIAFFEEGGRIVFVIPWPGSVPLSLVGTTDCDHNLGPDNVHITPEEVRYLRGIVSRLFPGAGAPEPVAAFSALRPLVQSGTAATKASREHRIWKSPDGVLHVAGGKFTTYRAIAEEVADRVCRHIAPSAVGKCITAVKPLGHTPITGETQAARIAHAARHEMVQRLPDLLFVSTTWAYERKWDAAALEPLAAELGRHLNWSRARVDEEIALTLRLFDAV